MRNVYSGLPVLIPARHLQATWKKESPSIPSCLTCSLVSRSLLCNAGSTSASEAWIPPFCILGALCLERKRLGALPCVQLTGINRGAGKSGQRYGPTECATVIASNLHCRCEICLSTRYSVRQNVTREESSELR